jgi:hypothetical protein
MWPRVVKIAPTLRLIGSTNNGLVLRVFVHRLSMREPIVPKYPAHPKAEPSNDYRLAALFWPSCFRIGLFSQATKATMRGWEQLGMRVSASRWMATRSRWYNRFRAMANSREPVGPAALAYCRYFDGRTTGRALPPIGEAAARSRTCTASACLRTSAT